MIRNDAILTFLLKIAAAATSYGFVFILSQTMSVADFGFVGTLLTASLVLAIIGAAGQQVALLRFVPALLVANKETDAGVLVARSFRLSLGGALILWLVGAACAFVAAKLGYITDWRVPALGLMLVPLTGLIDLQAALARAQHAFVLALLPKEVLWRASTGLAILVMYFAGGRLTITLGPVVFLLVLFLFGSAAAQFVIMHRKLPVAPTVYANNTGMPADWRRSIVPFWLFSTSAVYFANVDVAFVGAMFGGVDAGYYYAANRVAQALAFFLMSYNIAIGPVLSAQFHSGRMDMAAKAVTQASVQAFLPTAVLGVIFLIWAVPILDLFGPGFSSAAASLRILVLAGVFGAVFGPADLVLNMCGEAGKAMRVSLWSMLLGTTAMLVLASLLGPVGIAWGVLIATLIRKGGSWLVALHVLGIASDVVSPMLQRAAKTERV